MSCDLSEVTLYRYVKLLEQERITFAQVILMASIDKPFHCSHFFPQ